VVKVKDQLSTVHSPLPNLHGDLTQILLKSYSFFKVTFYSASMSQTIKYQTAEDFYIAVLKILKKSKIPFLIGGTYAVMQYTGINRPTKDLDIFCRVGDYQKILYLCRDHGFLSEITDVRWVAKIKTGDYLVDLIFGTAQGTWSVDDSWFVEKSNAKLFGLSLQLVPTEELIWSKAYVQDMTKYQGADIYHLILKRGRKIDWKKIRMRFEAHWEILLAHLINFRFVYPSEREIIPKSLMEELLDRVHQQFLLPTPQQKVCRGTLISRSQYQIDVNEWGYQDFNNPPVD
jgi:hypothetical protein